MRNNQPVTQKEVIFPAGKMIVSKTDLQGRITFVNRDFIDISGFTESELLGQSHNIVRHPDMPSAAFADLWGNLKTGRPWTGLVKNRCKNGDHYWVVANATPIFENGQVSGYMSVRSLPTRTQVDAAEKAYRELREGLVRGMTVRDGQVVRAGFSWSEWRRSRSIGQRIFAICVLLTAGMLLLGGLGIRGVSETTQRLDSVYREQVVPLQQLKEVADAYAVSIVDLSHKTRDGAESFESALDKVKRAETVIQSGWKAYTANVLTPEEQRLATELQPLMKLGDEATSRLKAILAEGDRGALSVFAAQALYPAIDPISDKIGELVNLQLTLAQVAVKAADEDNAAFKVRFGLLIAAFGLVGLMLSVALVAAIRRPITAAATFFRSLAEGRTDVTINFEQRDELLAISDAARMMQIKSGWDLNSTQEILADAQRIQMALDGAEIPMTISNQDNILIYMNRAAERLWTLMEPAMQQRVPGFLVANLRNHALVDFFDDESMKSAYRGEIAETRQLDVQMCGRILRVTATPVRDSRGQYLGRASQWIDRTLEVAVENEVADIVGAAARGDFSRRVDEAGKQGFFLRLASDLNTLLQTSQLSLDEVAQVLSAIASGDLGQRVGRDYLGTFAQLKDSTNLTAEQLSAIIEQIRQASDAINVAAREIATGNQDLSSRTEEQASSLEETASSMEQLTSTVKQNADNARQANELASGAQLVAIKGGEVVGEVVATMTAINDSSRRIADIIGVIDGIAFQTNILALNAAVEAARAGEQGRGFAVVATEVRNLAQRSAAAAKEIKGLISESVDKVESGNRLVDQAGRTMSEVVSSIKRVAAIVTDIAEASREQSAGIEQVSLAVSQMDEVTQQNAALVEQAAAAAESLEEQAESLVRAVAIFRLQAGGAVAPAALPHPASKSSAAPQAEQKKLPRARLDDEWAEF